MENMAGGRDIKPEEAAKAKGVVQEMKTEKFVSYISCWTTATYYPCAVLVSNMTTQSVG